MKIIKVSAPLPLEEIPIERGGQEVDYSLTEEEAQEIEERFQIVEHVDGGALGEGQFGIAYATRDGKVLKLTTDELEYTVADLLMRNNYGPFAEVYKVGKIKRRLYYVLKELVTPLTEEERNNFDTIINLYTDYLDEQNYPEYIDPKFAEEVEDYVNSASNAGFGDVLSVDNIGRNKHGVMVCFDPR